jgi:Putative Actinobacterial Holin-X, holin superfamily III
VETLSPPPLRGRVGVGGPSHPERRSRGASTYGPRTGRSLTDAFPVPRPYSFLTVNRGQPSSAELAQDIVQDAQQLVRLEVQLARQELKELAIRNGIAIGLLAFGGVLLALALLVVLPVLLIQLWGNHVLGAIIWLGTYVGVGAVLVLVGRFVLRLEPPPRTLASLEETKAWALRQMRSSGR